MFSAVLPSAQQLGGFPGPRRPPHCQQRNCEKNQSQGKVPLCQGGWYLIDKLLPRAAPLQPRAMQKPCSQAEVRSRQPTAPEGQRLAPPVPPVRPELLAHRLSTSEPPWPDALMLSCKATQKAAARPCPAWPGSRLGPTGPRKGPSACRQLTYQMPKIPHPLQRLAPHCHFRPVSQEPWVSRSNRCGCAISIKWKLCYRANTFKPVL